MKILPFILLLFVLGTAGCKKKEGCTDVSAINYDKEAEKNDGSCQFEGNLVMWFNFDSAQYFEDDGTATLDFYVDDEYQGTLSVGDYRLSEPLCGDSKAITYTTTFGATSYKTVTYDVYYDNGYKVSSGWIDVKAKQCIKLEIY